MNLRSSIYHLPSKIRIIRRIMLVGLFLVILVTSSLKIWEYINPSKTVEAAWYTSGNEVWAFRKKFTVNGSKVADTGSGYTNFHMVINMTLPDLADKAQNDGGDILFTDASGTTKWDHEIEKFNNETGELVAWVEVPTLNDADTDFYMYYGNQTVTNQANKSGMWSSSDGFRAVWHMAEDPSASAGCDGSGSADLCDSTSGDHDGTAGSGFTTDQRVGGKIGDAVDFGGIASEDFYDVGTGGSLAVGTEDFSVLVWLQLDDPMDFYHIFDYSSGNLELSQRGFEILARYDLSGEAIHWRMNDASEATSTGCQSSTPEWDDGTWKMFTVTVDRSSSGRCYYNATLDDTTTVTGKEQSITPTNSNTAAIGTDADLSGDHDGDGRIDEIWFLNKVISTDELTTIYNNQSNNHEFFSYIGASENRKEPRAHWKMDEGSGSTIYDSVGERTDGTATSTTWETTQANCVMGTCLTFGTSNNRVTVSDNVDLDFTAGTSFSLETWIKHDTASAQQVIVSKYNEAGYKLLMESDGDITCGIDYDSTWTPTDSVTSTLAIYDDNNWHHVACVKSANTSLTLYIDGVSVGTPDTSLTNSTLANTDPFYIGIDADASSLDWVGGIDEVKLYDYARSAQEILTDFNIGFSSSGSNAVLGRFAAGSPIPDTLISRWKFDDLQGTTVEDSISTGLDLTLTSASWSPSGKMGGAYLGVTNDRATIADNANLDFTASDTFALTGWFKHNTASAAEYLIYKENGNEGYTVYMDSDGDVVFGIGDTSSVSFPEETIGGSLSANYDDDNWHHFVAVKNGTTGIYLYIDGILIASDTSLTTDATLANGGSFFIGDANATDGTDEWLGLIDDIKIFDTALTASQVKVDYNAMSAINFGTGGASESASLINGPPNPPVGYYPLDENTGSDGGTAYDKSGNGRNGTLTNVDTGDWVPGKYGSSLSLTAAGTEYIEVGTGPSDVETVTFWVKPTATTDDFINLISTTTYIDASSGTVRLEGQASETVYVNGILNGTITTDVWQHVAVVSASSLNASNLEIGRVGATPSYLNGVIDEVKLFDSALTQAQVAYDYNRGNPVGWWRLDEPELNWCGTNTDGCDASGFGYDLLAQGNATTVSVSGKFDRGLELDGTGDYYCLDNDDNGSCDTSTTKMQFAGDLTLSAWINLDTFTDADTIIYQGENGSDTEANNELYFLRVDTTSGNDIEYGHESGAGTDNYQVFDTNLSADTWYHLTLVRNTTANTVQLYLNGNSTGSASSYSADPTGGSTGEWAIGANDNGSNDVDGMIDEVRVYNYAMSANQIKSIVNNGSVRFD